MSVIPDNANSPNRIYTHDSLRVPFPETFSPSNISIVLNHNTMSYNFNSENYLQNYQLTSDPDSFQYPSHLGQLQANETYQLLRKLAGDGEAYQSSYPSSLSNYSQSPLQNSVLAAGYPMSELPESFPKNYQRETSFSQGANPLLPALPFKPYETSGKLAATQESQTHTISRLVTGEDIFIRKNIRHLTKLDKLSLSASFGNMDLPNFFCELSGCQRPWISDRGQIKEHLLEHNIGFKKPWECSCGSQFKRRVEASRHLEDLTPCHKCRGPGRKIRSPNWELICYRCHKKEIQ